MQDAIEGVLYANKVDVVFSGHVHACERNGSATVASQLHAPPRDSRMQPPPCHPAAVVTPSPLPADERSCKVFNYECMPDAPLYLTVGDGGNREGLATTWCVRAPRRRRRGHCGAVARGSEESINSRASSRR